MGGSPEEPGSRCRDRCYSVSWSHRWSLQKGPSFSGSPVRAVSAVPSLASQQVIQLSEGLICPHSACEGLQLDHGVSRHLVNVFLGVSVKVFWVRLTFESAD